MGFPKLAAIMIPMFAGFLLNSASQAVYESPQKDMRYNIADFKTIDQRYGTIDDVEELIVELKKRGMKLFDRGLDRESYIGRGQP